jgi:hypothetical protein
MREKTRDGGLGVAEIEAEFAIFFGIEILTFWVGDQKRPNEPVPQ